MFDYTTRTEMIYSKSGLEQLSRSNVCLLGVGGVGSYAFEALVRGGVGSITIADKDVIDKTNINRQLIALHSNIGEKKVDAAKLRAQDINPQVKIEALDIFYLNRNDIDFSSFDYVVDAIDNVTGKLAIAESCHEKGIKLISAMGCGNRKDPSKLKIADIYETSGCPLCKVMRKELRSLGIESLEVVYSTEEYIRTENRTPGSTPFVPAIAGLMMAGRVINFLAERNGNNV